ncbi:ABC transporter permease [Planctomycetaceae bacterium SCGC AG-212-F19]|nr:ABC transporter permease [Planctomycetaceae bacterium SCGC AG-212-F19]
MKQLGPWRSVLADYLGMALVLGGLIAIFGTTTQHFFTFGTFRTIANQIPVALIIAVGMTYVLVIGGIDLSVGSVLALGGSVFGVCLVKLELPLPVAILACLATGVACGAINGLVMIRWGLPSFIVTLGMLEMARGGAYLVTESRTMYIGSSLAPIAESSVGGLSVSFILAVVLALVGHVVLARTVFGRYLVAIGTNEEVVRLAGIDPRPIKLLVFMLSGLLAALAAVMHCARLSSADPNAGSGFELQAIAAVVIGGTSLMGGRGSVVNSLFGVLIMAVLETGLIQLRAGEPTKRLITGAVIVAAVIVDQYRHRLGKAN